MGLTAHRLMSQVTERSDGMQFGPITIEHGDQKGTYFVVCRHGWEGNLATRGACWWNLRGAATLSGAISWAADHAIEDHAGNGYGGMLLMYKHFALAQEQPSDPDRPLAPVWWDAWWALGDKERTAWIELAQLPYAETDDDLKRRREWAVVASGRAVDVANPQRMWRHWYDVLTTDERAYWIMGTDFGQCNNPAERLHRLELAVRQAWEESRPAQPTAEQHKWTL